MRFWDARLATAMVRAILRRTGRVFVRCRNGDWLRVVVWNNIVWLRREDAILLVVCVDLGLRVLRYCGCSVGCGRSGVCRVCMIARGVLPLCVISEIAKDLSESWATYRISRHDEICS